MIRVQSPGQDMRGEKRKLTPTNILRHDTQTDAPTHRHRQTDMHTTTIILNKNLKGNKWKESEADGP